MEEQGRKNLKRIVPKMIEQKVIFEIENNGSRVQIDISPMSVDLPTDLSAGGFDGQPLSGIELITL